MLRHVVLNTTKASIHSVRLYQRLSFLGNPFTSFSITEGFQNIRYQFNNSKENSW